MLGHDILETLPRACLSGRCQLVPGSGGLQRVLCLDSALLPDVGQGGAPVQRRIRDIHRECQVLQARYEGPSAATVRGVQHD